MRVSAQSMFSLKGYLDMGIVCRREHSSADKPVYGRPHAPVKWLVPLNMQITTRYNVFPPFPF